jgi:hypothetical protein
VQNVVISGFDCTLFNSYSSFGNMLIYLLTIQRLIVERRQYDKKEEDNNSNVSHNVIPAVCKFFKNLGATSKF